MTKERHNNIKEKSDNSIPSEMTILVARAIIYMSAEMDDLSYTEKASEEDEYCFSFVTDRVWICFYANANNCVMDVLETGKDDHSDSIILPPATAENFAEILKRGMKFISDNL
jgi:hypothetical protein